MTVRRGKNGAKQHAGYAGLVAGVAFAVAGSIFGAAASYFGELGAAASAAKLASQEQSVEEPSTITAPTHHIAFKPIAIDRKPPERFDAPDIPRAPAPAAPVKEKPKIIVILDDIGLDAAMADAAFSLPGPVTYSILPYAKDVQFLAAMASAGGGDVMLHLPMEPHGDEEPGPHALRADMTGGAFFRSLEWNLAQFENYVGVNNHMGSKLTTDRAAMRLVLDTIKNRDLFFIDSVTTNESVAHEVGARMGVKVLRRDVFLDPTPGDRALVRLQLRLAEQIALETGYAIAIGHPRPETLDVLGPWLASVEARGFELTTPSALIAGKPPSAQLASAPALRF